MTLVNITGALNPAMNGLHEVAQEPVRPLDQEKMEEIRRARREMPELFMDSSPEVMAKQAAFAGVRAMQIARLMGKEYSR
mgnify:CR=1 FL=1